MFSQYSWGDFIKFILALAIPYYAYVAWKYYREDIREWLFNRGQSNPAQTTVDDEDDEEPTTPSRFTVNNYDEEELASSSPMASQPKAAEWLAPMPSPSNSSPATQVEAEPAFQEVELVGPSISRHSEESFSLPLALIAENPQELSLDQIISAAARIAPDAEGVLSPIQAGDEPAAKIAVVLNNQQGRAVFSDFTFVR